MIWICIFFPCLISTLFCLASFASRDFHSAICLLRCFTLAFATADVGKKPIPLIPQPSSAASLWSSPVISAGCHQRLLDIGQGFIWQRESCLGVEGLGSRQGGSTGISLGDPCVETGCCSTTLRFRKTRVRAVHPPPSGRGISAFRRVGENALLTNEDSGLFRFGDAWVRLRSCIEFELNCTVIGYGLTRSGPFVDRWLL